MRGLKIAGIIALAALLLLALIVAVRILTEETSNPLNVSFSNLSDSQITLTWYTQNPVRGAVLISGSSDFPISSFFSKNLFQDTRDNGFNRGRFKTHLVTVTGLSENKKYYFRIYEGIYSKFEGSFTTGPALEPTKLKWTAQGQVLQSDGTPAPQEIVYYQLTNKQGNSATLTTLTDDQGFYQFDVSGLRSRNNLTYYPFLNSEEVIYTKNGGTTNAIATDDYLLLKSRKDLIIK